VVRKPLKPCNEATEKRLLLKITNQVDEMKEKVKENRNERSKTR
jgi:hypothetical protein